MAKKRNISEEEQQRVTAEVTGTAPAPARVAKGKITLSITREDHKIIKKYAVDHDTTVSDLLHDWIQEHCRMD